MEAFYKYHPQAEEKFQNYSHISIGYFSGGYQTTKCFFFEKTDGTHDSTSYVKTVNMIFDLQNQQLEIKELSQNEYDLITTVLKFIHKMVKKFPKSQKKLMKLIKINYPHRAQCMIN